MISLGRINLTAGTPIVIDANGHTAARIRIQVAAANAGIVYVGRKALVTGSGVGVVAILAKPASATTGPFDSITFESQMGMAAQNTSQYYVDGTTNDGVYVSYE